jgi:hypothetical protein
METDHVPGTVHQLDLAGQEVTQLRLVPRPSDDVNDPLNWTKRRKLISALCIYTYVLIVNLIMFWG